MYFINTISIANRYGHVSVQPELAQRFEVGESEIGGIMGIFYRIKVKIVCTTHLFMNTEVYFFESLYLSQYIDLSHNVDNSIFFSKRPTWKLIEQIFQSHP